MVAASDIPLDVWLMISSHIVHPKHHIILSQICPNSRSMYIGEDKWKQMCLSIGVGRGSLECRMSWKNVYIEVVSHRDRCKVPQCYQYGVPPMSSVGDLLDHPAAIIDHCEYFRQEIPCTCGRQHAATAGGAHSSEGSDEHEDDEEDYDDEDDDDSDNDMPDLEENDEGYVFNGPYGSIHTEDDDMAAMTGFLNLMGIPVPPGFGTGTASAPAGPSNPHDHIPAPLHPNPFAPQSGVPAAVQGPVALANLLNGLYPPPPPAPAATKATPKPKARSRDPVQPKLPPLTYKNRKRVPSRPLIHPLLAETGSIQFQRFLDGFMALHATIGPTTSVIRTSTYEGVDWDKEDQESDDGSNPNIEEIEEHPLLARAFATNPPVAELVVNIESFVTKVYNSDGVTIKDVIHHMNRYLRKPISSQERINICGPPHSGCHLDKFNNRLNYVLGEYAIPTRNLSSNGPGNVKECWLKGIGECDTRTGEMNFSLFGEGPSLH